MPIINKLPYVLKSFSQSLSPGLDGSQLFFKTHHPCSHLSRSRRSLPHVPYFWNSKKSLGLLFPMVHPYLLSGSGHFSLPLTVLMCNYPNVFLHTLCHIRLVTCASILMASSIWPLFPWPFHCQRWLPTLDLISTHSHEPHSPVDGLWVQRSQVCSSKINRCEVLGKCEWCRAS